MIGLKIAQYCHLKTLACQCNRNLVFSKKGRVLAGLKQKSGPIASYYWFNITILTFVFVKFTGDPEFGERLCAGQKPWENWRGNYFGLRIFILPSMC